MRQRQRLSRASLGLHIWATQLLLSLLHLLARLPSTDKISEKEHIGLLQEDLRYLKITQKLKLDCRKEGKEAITPWRRSYVNQQPIPNQYCSLKEQNPKSLQIYV